jgi:hypothetical protein
MRVGLPIALPLSRTATLLLPASPDSPYYIIDSYEFQYAN